MNKEQFGIAIVLVMALFTACPNGTGTDGDAVLAAPSNLRLLGATSDSVTIGWTAVAGAVSYKVYRCATPGGQYVCVNGAGTSDSRYTDSGLSSSATFYYKVSAVGSNGLESSQSNYVQTSTEVPPPLPPPASVWVTNTTKNSITIAWTPVSGAAKYEIWWCLTSVGQYNKLDEAVAATYIHEGLPFPASYYYKVKALGSNGVTSELSSYVKGTTKDQDGSSPVLATPTGLHVTDTTSTSVSLAWNTIPGAASYTIYRGTGSGSVTEFAGTASSTAYTVTGLAANTAYYFTISAVGTEADTESPASEPVSATTSSVSLDAPGTLTVSPGNTQLTVSWTAVDGATAYEVWTGTTNNSTSATKYGADITGLSATINSLTNGRTYYVWVKAKNATGASDFSPMANGTPVIPIVVPQAPAAPTVTAGNTQLTISWTAVDGATAYEVWTGTTNNSASAAKYGADITGLSATINNLNNGTTSYVWIKAKNSAGTSSFSPQGSGTPSAPPLSINGTVIVKNELTAGTWDRIYGVELRKDGTTIIDDSNEITRNKSRTYSDLTPGSYSVLISFVGGSRLYADFSLNESQTKLITVTGDYLLGTANIIITTIPQVETSITITLATQNDVSLSDQSVVISRGQSRGFQVIESYTKYQWYLNGNAISWAVAGSYTLNTASMKLGVYELSVIVITGAGVKLSGNCRVRVE